MVPLSGPGRWFHAGLSVALPDGYSSGRCPDTIGTRAMTDRLVAIREKVHAGERLTFEDGVYLDRHADLHSVGELANVVRERKNGSVTYFNVNEHLNPTNVCVYRCT